MYLILAGKTEYVKHPQPKTIRWMGLEKKEGDEDKLIKGKILTATCRAMFY